MAAVQSVLLQVASGQLQGTKQAPLDCNSHPDLTLDCRPVRECNARPFIRVVRRRFRNPRYHGRPSLRVTQHGEQVHTQTIKCDTKRPPHPHRRVG